MLTAAEREARRALRREFRARRRAIPGLARRAAALAAVRVLARHGLPKAGARIAVYLPGDGEFDPGPLCTHARARGCRIYVPVLAGARLAFGPIDAPRRAWRLNRYGIAEPGADPRLLRGARALDLVFLPLVAFDARGHRLGMGAGWYDRTFAFLRGRAHWRRPRLVGLAFDAQQAPELPAAAWDVPLDGILTATRYLRVR